MQAAPPRPGPAPPAPRPSSSARGPLATLSAPAVIGSGVGPVPMTATLRSLRRDGQLTVIEVGVTQVGKTASGVGYFGDRNDRNVGRWRLVVPATGAVYLPAVDGGPPADSNAPCILGTQIKAMNGDVESLITFWTAVLPADLQRVDVDLGQLGIARDSPISG